MMVTAHCDYPHPTQARLRVLAEVSARTGLEPRTPWAAPGSESGCLEPPEAPKHGMHICTVLGPLGADNLFQFGSLVQDAVFLTQGVGDSSPANGRGIPLGMRSPRIFKS